MLGGARVSQQVSSLSRPAIGFRAFQGLGRSEKGTIKNSVLYSGFNNYLYYCGGSLLHVWYSGLQNPILIIKAPTIAKTAYWASDLRARRSEPNAPDSVEA